MRLIAILALMLLGLGGTARRTVGCLQAVPRPPACLHVELPRPDVQDRIRKVHKVLPEEVGVSGAAVRMRDRHNSIGNVARDERV